MDAGGKLTGGLLGWRSSFTAPMLGGEPDSAALALPDDQTRRVLITSLVISTGSSGSRGELVENGTPRILLGSSNGMWCTIRSHGWAVATVPAGRPKGAC